MSKGELQKIWEKRPSMTEETTFKLKLKQAEFNLMFDEKLNKIKNDLDIQTIKNMYNWIHFKWHEFSKLHPNSACFTLHGKECVVDFKDGLAFIKNFEKLLGDKR